VSESARIANDHSVVFHAPAAVVLEIKVGPYEPQLDKEFASWAPPENDSAAARFVSWLETAVPGEAVVDSLTRRVLRA
jgi:hypothetical protein